MTLSEEVGTEKGAILNEQYKAPKNHLPLMAFLGVLHLEYHGRMNLITRPFMRMRRKKSEKLFFQDALFS